MIGWWRRQSTQTKIGVIGVLLAFLALLPAYLGFRIIVETRANTTPAQPGRTAETISTTPPGEVIPTWLPSSPSIKPSPSSHVDGPSTTAPVELNLNDRVAFDSCTAGWYTDPAAIAGVSYPKAIKGQCRGNPGEASIDFLVPAGAKQLIGVAGIADDSPNTQGKIVFMVHNVNGTPLIPNTTLGYGQTWSLSVPVDGVLRIRLKILPTAELDEWVYPCWANMRFEF